MELVSSNTLFQFVKAKKLDECKAMGFALKIGSALEYLHENGIILRNLEAKGILMTDEQNTDELIYES